MVIACGDQHTGNPALCDVARAKLDMCYEHAWSTNLGGGEVTVIAWLWVRTVG
jgi:hypothetical protein